MVTCSQDMLKIQLDVIKHKLVSRVERRFGWDTHGLPAELEAERILGIEDKSQIGNRWVLISFNEVFCRSSVLKYTKEWEEYVTRQARWVDFENDYKTLDINYMESVIWALKPCTIKVWHMKDTGYYHIAGTIKHLCLITNCVWMTTMSIKIDKIRQ